MNPFGLTPTQILLSIIIGCNAVTGLTAQFTTIFGTVWAGIIIAAAAIVSTILGAIAMPLTGQAATVKNVLAMPGVDSLKVNAQASQTLAQIAVDPAVNKISPVVSMQDKVEAIAKGAS
jgi:hypothetical protein